MPQQPHHHHCVPQFHLKRFSADDTHIYQYALIVHHDNQPLWQRRAIKGVASVDDFYTSRNQGEDCTALETELCERYEAPAATVFRKLDAGRRLNPAETQRLTEYIQLQFVRTPAMCAHIMGMAPRIATEVLPKALEETMQRLASRPPTPRTDPLNTDDPYLSHPVFDVGLTQAPEGTAVQVNTPISRDLFLAQVEHSMRPESAVSEVFANLEWLRVETTPNLELPITDNPVALIGSGLESPAYGLGRVGLGAGTHIIFPLNPHSFLFSVVGWTAADMEPLARSPFYPGMARTAIIRNARMAIYARGPLSCVQTLRPRTVDPTLAESIKQSLGSWSTENAKMVDEFQAEGDTPLAEQTFTL